MVLSHETEVHGRHIMKIFPPILGYTLKGLCHPFQFLATQALFALPLAPGIKMIRDLPYGAHPNQRLDIYHTNKADSGPLPVVLFIHGGAWINGDKSMLHCLCQRVAAQGYLVININYRLAPQYLYQQQIQDISMALSWIQQNSHDYNGDKMRIFMAGDTAGANLAMTYATALGHPYLRNALYLKPNIDIEQIKGLILIYGAFDLERGLFSYMPNVSKQFCEIFLGYSNEQLAEWIEVASPLRHLHPNIPPIFITAGEVDPLFTQSVLLAQRLRSMHHDYSTAFYSQEKHPDAHYLFFNFLRRSFAKEAMDEACMFLHFFSEHHGSVKYHREVEDETQLLEPNRSVQHANV